MPFQVSFHSKLKIINFNDIVFMILQDGVCCDFAVLNGRYVAACFEVSLYLVCSIIKVDDSLSPPSLPPFLSLPLLPSPSPSLSCSPTSPYMILRMVRNTLRSS